MKRSLSALIVFMVASLLSGCIISKSPNMASFVVLRSSQQTFKMIVFPPGASYTWTLDGETVTGQGSSYLYVPTGGSHTLTFTATHFLGTDTLTWAIVDAEAVQTIGNTGGTVEVTDPESSLVGTKVVLPENALFENETISIAIENNPPEVPLPDGFSAEGECISFESTSESFNGPVYLMIPYSGDRQEDEARIVYTYNDISCEWEPVVPLPTTDPNLFIGEVYHFSKYVKAKATISLTKIQSGFSMEDDTLAYDNAYGQCAGMALLASEYYNNWANKEGESLRCRWDKEESELASIDAHRRWLGKDTSTTEKLGTLFNAFLLLINWTSSVIDGSYVVDYVKVMAGFNKVVPIFMLGFSPPGHVVVATGWEKTGLLSGKINIYDVTYPDSDFMSIPYVTLPPIIIKLNYDEYFVFLIGNDWGLNIDETIEDYPSQHLCLAEPITQLLDSMVPIPAGSFMMGSTEVEETMPVHQVTLQAFDIGKYEVTQAQYEAVMGTNPSYFQGTGYPDSANRPVEQVSYYDAKLFCTALSTLTDRTFTLPSEAQWEYACRAGTTTLYSWGDSDSLIGNYAWYNGNSSGTTHPIGTKMKNPWELYDMHGNVWEWCLDSRHDNYFGSPTDGSAWEPDTGAFRMLRGGSWYDFSPVCFHSAIRYTEFPDYGDFIIGFRVVEIP